MKKLTRIKDIIERVAGKTGLGEKLREAKAFELWFKEVGREISAHTQPIKLIEGKLFVKVDEPIWMTQLTFLKKNIIDKLNKSPDNFCIKDIFFTLNN